MMIDNEYSVFSNNLFYPKVTSHPTINYRPGTTRSERKILPHDVIAELPTARKSTKCKTTVSNRRSVSIVSWNIQSRNSSHTGNKFNDPAFRKIFENHDIVCLQETKNDIKIENYCCYNNTRSGGPKAGGGVSILLKNTIKRGVKLISKTLPDIIVVQLNKNFFHTQNHIYLITAYVSPINSKYRARLESNPWDAINDAITKYSAKGDVILCGDLNAHTSQAADFVLDSDRDQLNIPDDFQPKNTADTIRPRNNSDSRQCKNGDELIDTAISHDLIILNGRTLGDLYGKMTYHGPLGSSCVDYFLCPAGLQKSLRHLSVNDLQPEYSDHCPVSIILDTHQPFQSEHVTHNFDRFPGRYKWEDDSATKFTAALNNSDIREDLESIANTTDHTSKALATKLNSRLISCITSAADKTLRQTKPPKMPKKQKWFNYECVQAKRELQRASRRWAKHTASKDKREKVYEKKRQYREVTRKNKFHFLDSLNKSIEDGKVLNWKNFKKLKQSHQEPDNLDPHDLANFYDYFVKLYKAPTDPHNTGLDQPSEPNQDNNTPIHDKLSVPITIHELRTTLRSLKNGKGVAEDLISNEMLKNLNQIGFGALLNTFNACLKSGTYPWHCSVITPIHKAGDRYDPDNYRAIAVSSCLGKAFSSILLSRLIAFRAEHCDDPVNQLGYRKGAQTNDHILTIKTLIDKYKKKKKKLYTCFVDLKKAFDTISRTLLLHKLTSLNIKGTFFSVLNDMYNNSTAKIKINGLLSDTFNIENGTEQGHPMSPELFKLFIKDLTSFLNTNITHPDLAGTIISHLLWADDLVLLALSEASLQANIDKLAQYCEKWGLTINLKKTKVVVFGTNKRSKTKQFFLNRDCIETVDSYCYLGIVIHKNGSFKVAINELRKKALRAFFGLKRTIIKNSLSLDSLLKLHDTLIKPILLYGCQIMTPHQPLVKNLAHNKFKLTSINSDPIELFHLKYLKWSCNVHRKASNIGIYGDTGRYPLSFHAIKLSVDYFNRVLTMNPNALVYKAYEEQKSLNLDWYQTLHTFNKTDSQSDITTHLQTLFKDTWRNELQLSTKLDFYRTLKTEFCRENYLTIINPKYRSAITKLRLSAHRLRIEVGRYTKPLTPRDMRYCQYCQNLYNQLTVETEVHALLDCPLHKTARKSLHNHIARPIEEILRNSDDITSLSRVGKFINAIFSEHRGYDEFQN